MAAFLTTHVSVLQGNYQPRPFHGCPLALQIFMQHCLLCIKIRCSLWLFAQHHTCLPPAGELSGPPLTRLALATLGSFDFGQQGLLQWVCDNITSYLDNGDVSIRRAAATAVAQVLQQHVAHVTAGQRPSAYHVSWGAQ